MQNKCKALKRTLLWMRPSLQQPIVIKSQRGQEDNLGVAGLVSGEGLRWCQAFGFIHWLPWQVDLLASDDLANEVGETDSPRIVVENEHQRLPSPHIKLLNEYVKNIFFEQKKHSGLVVLLEYSRSRKIDEMFAAEDRKMAGWLHNTSATECPQSDRKQGNWEKEDLCGKPQPTRNSSDVWWLLLT